MVRFAPGGSVLEMLTKNGAQGLNFFGRRGASPEGASPPKDVYKLRGFVCAIGMYILYSVSTIRTK